MNEKILELAQKAAGKDYSFFTFHPSDFDSYEQIEKFAELIVAECIEQMSFWERIDLAIRGIKQYFGVKK